MVFVEILNELKRLPNKLWVDQGKEHYNGPMPFTMFR